MRRSYIKKNYRIKMIIMNSFIVKFVISALLLFIMLAIGSGNHNDPSWCLVYSTQPTIINWCGVVGAHIFSLLFYLFGYAAFLFIPGNVWLVYMIWYRLNTVSMMRSSTIFFMLLMISSFLIQAHQHQWLVSVMQPCSGGFFGFYIHYALYAIFNRIGSLLIGYTMLFLFFILLISYQRMRYILKLLSKKCLLILWWIGYTTYYIAQVLSQTVHLVVHKFLYTKTTILHDKAQYIQTDNLCSNKQNKIADQSSFSMPSPQEIFEIDQEENEFILHNKNNKEAQELIHVIEEKLQYFGVRGKVTAIRQGPVVTLFEYQPTIDSKISKIVALEDDLALALKALSIRIIAPIPGRSVIGLEVSNKKAQSVLFASLVVGKNYETSRASLPLILGKDTIGNSVIIDLAKMPHLLVAGSTGSGKSVALNSMIMSLLCKYTPDKLRLIVIDPKRLEFAMYTDIAHLLFPIITHTKKTIPILRWVVHEMEMRYEKMSQMGVRNIMDYNLLSSATKIPFIVLIIDELADLMMTAGREVEDLLARIAQMARAAGIHMIVATQRPSVDVITGTIKVNFPARISFRVTSKVDSRTILDASGAERLLGKGDMLLLDAQSSSLMRIHGAYVSDQEIVRMVNYIKQQQSVVYQTLDLSFEQSVSAIDQEDEKLLQQILVYLQTIDEVSISLLQRKFRIGYNRSARMIEILEQKGHIATHGNGKLRKVVRSF